MPEWPQKGRGAEAAALQQTMVRDCLAIAVSLLHELLMMMMVMMVCLLSRWWAECRRWRRRGRDGG